MLVATKTDISFNDFQLFVVTEPGVKTQRFTLP